MKLIGKLQDGTAFLKKGHGEDEEPFEFKTDEGINREAQISFTIAIVTMIILKR